MLYFIHSINEEFFTKQVKLLTTNHTTIEINLEPNNTIDVTNQINSIDLFQEKRAFIIYNATFFQIKSHKFKKKELEHLINAFNNSEDTIIIHLPKKINYKNNYLNGILKKEIIELVNEEQVLDYFINLFIQNNQININLQNLNQIKYNLNQNLLAIENELLKLHNFTNHKEITKQVISEFGISTVEANSFNLLELILQNDINAAKGLYEQIIIDGTNPVSLLGLISTQLRFLYQVKVLSNSYSATEISQLLNANNYRVKITLKQVNKYSIHHLNSFYLKVAQIDYLVKSGNLNLELIIDYLLYR